MGKALSKAFTKEVDDADEEELTPEAEQPQGVKNYITPAGYARMHAELKQLLDVERPQTVSVVHWAASNGDRSENGDYIYGKKRLREIDRRIRFLIKRLEIAEVVDSSGQDAGPRVLRRHRRRARRRRPRAQREHRRHGRGRPARAGGSAGSRLSRARCSRRGRAIGEPAHALRGGTT